ncbi:MAG: hypothetical protein ACOYB3_01060 [Azonexus sp.]
MATKIVDGLLDPNTDDLDSFVQGALTSDFGQFMRSSGTGSSWPQGAISTTYDTRIESDDGPNPPMVKVILQVSANKHVGMSNPDKGFTDINFYVTTNLKKWEGHFRKWDFSVKHLTDDEVSQAAQLTFIWINQAVPRIINNRSDNEEALRSIPARLEFQLKRAMHPLRKGEAYEPPVA